MRKPIEGWWSMTEPGDGTRYEFIVTSVPGRDAADALFIASVARGSGAPRFTGYIYNIASLLEFKKRWAPAFEADYNTFENVVRDLGSDPFIDYAVEHSNANPWTALAGLMAGARIADYLND